MIKSIEEYKSYISKKTRRKTTKLQKKDKYYEVGFSSAATSTQTKKSKKPAERVH